MKIKFCLVFFLILYSLNLFAITDYYKIMGVAPSATSDEIKQAYRRLAKKFHPDLNGGSLTASEIFKQINVANDVLSDPAKRAKYDYQLKISPKSKIKPQGKAQPKPEPKTEPTPPPRAEAKAETRTSGSSYTRNGSYREEPPRYESRTYNGDNAKKYEWQSFDDKPNNSSPNSGQANSKEPPKEKKFEWQSFDEKSTTSAQDTAKGPPQEKKMEWQSFDEKPINADIKAKMNMYKSPSCNKGFLGTVIDTLI